MSALAEKQEYDIPMYLGGELTRVHLTLEREKENAGQVALIVTMPGKNGQDESLEANFSVSGERLSGYYVTNQPDMVMKLKQVLLKKTSLLKFVTLAILSIQEIKRF